MSCTYPTCVLQEEMPLLVQCSMPDVTADNLTLDGATDGLPADAAADSTAEESTCNSKSSSKQKSSGTATTFNVKRLKHTADDEIDVNRCCVYFEMYADDAGTRREWLECQCSRWIHEDCTEDNIIDTEHCIFVHFVKTMIILKRKYNVA